MFDVHSIHLRILTSVRNRNVWAYEQLLLINPRIGMSTFLLCLSIQLRHWSQGSALTFSQMLFITTQSLPSFLTFKPNYYFPRLKPRQVPLGQWAIQVFVLTTGSLLNNWAFAYQVPLTVLIVFRSAGRARSFYLYNRYLNLLIPGLAVSMLFGYVFLKKRYSLLQIVRLSCIFKASLLS